MKDTAFKERERRKEGRGKTHVLERGGGWKLKRDGKDSGYRGGKARSGEGKQKNSEEAEGRVKVQDQKEGSNRGRRGGDDSTNFAVGEVKGGQQIIREKKRARGGARNGEQSTSPSEVRP